MGAKSIVALVVLTPIYWAAALPIAISVGWEFDFQCTRGSPTLHPCPVTKWMIPALLLAAAFIYAWIVWVFARRAERDRAELERLSDGGPRFEGD